MLEALEALELLDDDETELTLDDKLDTLLEDGLETDEVILLTDDTLETLEGDELLTLDALELEDEELETLEGELTLLTDETLEGELTLLGDGELLEAIDDETLLGELPKLDGLGLALETEMLELIRLEDEELGLTLADEETQHMVKLYITVGQLGGGQQLQLQLQKPPVPLL